MKDAELIRYLGQWEDYLSPFSVFDLFQDVAFLFKAALWYLIVGLSHILDVMNGMAVKALVILNIQDAPAFQDFVKDYLPLFVALGIIFAGWTLIGMMVNRGQDHTLYDFYKNLLIAMIILIGFPWIWGQAAGTTVDIAKHINKTSAMSTNIISQNVSDLYYIDKEYQFDVEKFNQADESKDKAGLGLDKEKNFLPKDKNGNIALSDLSRINPVETINAEKPTVELSKYGKDLLAHKIQWAGTTAKAEKLDTGVLGFGDTHYYRYKVNSFRILFYLLMGIVVSGILTWKVGQIGYEIWYNGFLLQGAALFDLKSGKRLLALSQKFFISLGAVLIIFVMLVLFNMGYAYIDAVIATEDIGGFILNCILKVALLFTIIDGPNAFESVFGVDAGLKSATRSIIAMNQGSQLLRSGVNSLVGAGKFAARNAARGGGFIAGLASGVKTEPSQGEADAMNGIGADSGPKGGAEKEPHNFQSGSSQEKEPSSQAEGTSTGAHSASRGEGETTDNTFSRSEGPQSSSNDAKESDTAGENKANIQEDGTHRTSPDSSSPFPPDDFEAKVDEAKAGYATHGIGSDYSELLNGQDEEVLYAFEDVSLPHAVSATVQDKKEKAESHILAYENAKDNYLGIKQKEKGEVKDSLGPIVTPTPKSVGNAARKGHQMGETFIKATGFSPERRQAKEELDKAQAPFNHDGLYGGNPKGEMFDGH